jgi:probable F420-dependent oxidoreductase
VELGRVGIWNRAVAEDDPRSRDAAAELDELGYGAVWIGGSPPVSMAENVLAATSRLTVATGILNIWQHEAADVAAQSKAANERFGGRFLLGLGASHGPLVPNYAKPLSAMRDFLAGLDAAGHPKSERVLAALGPKMLELSAREAAGAHPYLVTPEHTALARRTMGPAALLAPEQKVVLDPDPARARALGRPAVANPYLGLSNYTNNLRRLGWSDADLADGGSDALIDALVAHGTAADVAARLQQHLDAGADHVAVHLLTRDDEDAEATFTTLAGALPR